MGALDAPEVIRRGREIAKRKRYLKWGILAYFACIWMTTIIVFLSRYASTSVADDLAKSPDRVFNQVLAELIALPAALFLCIAFFYYIGRNPLNETQALPEGTPDAPAAVRRLRSGLESVSIATGRPPLECLVMQSDMPNAFSVIVHGEPYLVVTSGLIESDLSQREVTAIAAHEAAHVAVGDALGWRDSTRFYFSLFLLYGFSYWLFLFLDLFLIKRDVRIFGSGWFVFLVILAALPSMFVIYFERVVRRQDDLFADAIAVSITRDPDALSSAIKRIGGYEGGIDYRVFKNIARIGTRFGRSKSRFAMPAAASRYFFLNPLHNDMEMQREASESIPLRNRGILTILLPFSTTAWMERQRDAEQLFYEKRLQALEEIKRGEGTPLERVGKEPVG